MMVFHWSLSDSKSPQVSRTLLSILADLNNAVVWMVSTRPSIFKSSNSYTKPWVNVQSASITIGITVTFMFHSFFFVLLQGLGTYLSFRFPSVLPCGQLEKQIPQFDRLSFLLLIFTRFWSLAEIRWSVCISISQRIFFVSFFGRILGCAYTISL